MKKSESQAEQSEEVACNLVHDFGSAVVDTGCGKGLIGRDTLEEHCKVGGIVAKWIDCKPARFKYGGGSVDKSVGMVEIPAWIQGPVAILAQEQFLFKLCNSAHVLTALTVCALRVTGTTT